jgi:pimeloyl-ACP methyl ester carboxylesterase
MHDTVRNMCKEKPGGDTLVKHVISKDGVPIAYECSGSGAPLILVHGTAADHTRWKPLVPGLKRHFTVYAMDRRGRGQSGDGGPYSIEREYEDIAAVIDSITGLVNLFGHSYGAICALEAALVTPKVRRLILYEPPIPTKGTERYFPDALERIKDCLQAGKREDALLIFLREVAEIPEHEIDLLRSLPGWSFRVATAHTVPREQLSCEGYIFNPERFSRMKTDTLLLLGGSSPSFYRAAIDALNGCLPNSRIRIMPGQQHAAMNTAPELLLAEVMGFAADVSAGPEPI